MTIVEAKKIVKELGLRLIRKSETNEYVVCGLGNYYYTDCLQDAVDTAKHISKTHKLLNN